MSGPRPEWQWHVVEYGDEREVSEFAHAFFGPDGTSTACGVSLDRFSEPIKAGDNGCPCPRCFVYVSGIEELLVDRSWL